MNKVSKPTVIKLLVDLGTVCAEYQDEVLRDLPCERVQIDEIWSFCHAKAKNVPGEKKGQFGHGDVWTFTAICADTKLVPSWLVGSRDTGTATEFLQDLASRLAHRIQLTSDGHRMYLDAVDDAFAHEVDYAMLQKIYGDDPQAEKRYNPAKCNGTQRIRIQGNPDPRSRQHILRRTSEPHDADEHASVHAADERFLKEGREPRARHRAPLHALQLLPYPSVAARHSGNGSGRDGSPVGYRRHRAAARTSRSRATVERRKLKLAHYPRDGSP